jgi:hypothetical protein
MTATPSSSDNAPRFRAGTDHVESWFVRANDPTRPRALWLKATVLTRADGTSVAEAWCSVFDGDRAAAFRHTLPLADATFVADGSSSVGPLSLRLGPDDGRSTGGLASGQGTVRWDLTFARHGGPLGDPMCLLPSRRLVDGGFPRNKLLTPFPVATFGGQLDWDDQRWDLDGWVGMQGHNWGSAHSPEYAWGQCVFLDDRGDPRAVVEAASGRIELGRRRSPLFSMLVVRYDGREHRFDRIVDLWRQKPVLDFPSWTLAMRGRAGEATLAMTGDPAAMVCLGYDNPARPTSHCLNSKTADVRLAVRPKVGSPFTLSSGHGGALEFLQAAQVPEVQPVV